MRSAEIWILTPGFPASESDTNCIPSLQYWTEALREEFGDRIRVLSTQYPFESGSYVWKGIPVYAMGGQNRRGFFRIWILLKALFFLLRRTTRIQVFYSFWLFDCAFLAGLASFLTCKRTVWTIQGQDGRPGNSYFPRLRFLKHWAPVKVVAISEFLARETLKNSGIRSDLVLPYGTDPALESAFDPELPIRWDVMGAGSLVPVKNHHLFLDLVARLHARWPGLRVLLVGEGPERPRLENRIQELGLQEVVELRGEIPRPEVLRCMNQSQVFLHTSDWEGQGCVQIEALAMGMSVVARQVGWVPETEASVQVPDGELEEQVFRFLQNPSERKARIPLRIREDVKRLREVFEN